MAVRFWKLFLNYTNLTLTFYFPGLSPIVKEQLQVLANLKFPPRQWGPLPLRLVKVKGVALDVMVLVLKPHALMGSPIAP